MANENGTRFLDTYKKYCNKGWYGGVITSEGLDTWVNNFKKDYEPGFNPIICAHFLMHSLVFYQESQMKAIILSIKDKILARVNQNEEKNLGKRLSESELNDICQDYINKTCIISAATPQDVGSSAHSTIRLWRNTVDIDVANVHDLQNKINNGKKHIFFADDFIGTGTKMSGFLNNTIFPDSQIYGFKCVSEVIYKYSSVVDFNIVVFALHMRGKNEIHEKFPMITFYYGDLFDDNYDLSSFDCVYYDVFLDNKCEIRKYINQKNVELKSDDRYSLYLPIAFQHGCPNNSLVLYYRQSSLWNKLIDESNPQKGKGGH